jgi:hypothetical protein
MIDPILLGDNAFIGVDHLSQERAREKSGKFVNAEQVVDIIQHVSDLGVHGAVVSTHPNLRNVIDYMIAHTNLQQKIVFYPIIPYAQEYVTRMTEKGMMGAVASILEPATVQDKMRILIRGGIGMLKKDLYELLKIFIDVELLKLAQVNTNVIFLHDVLTDLALSLRMKDLFEMFVEHIADKHHVQAGLVTKNFPMLVRQLNEWNMSIPPIMTSFNKVGFQMNPSRDECEKCLREYDVDVIAMSTLAAGYINPIEAYEYLFQLPNIKSVVVGLSSKQHAKETIEIINKNLALYMMNKNVHTRV